MKSRVTTFQAIGTHWHIRIAGTLHDKAWQLLLQEIHNRINEFDTNYSRFRTDSLVTRMSQEAGVYELPADGFKLLQLYEKLYKLTDGKVTLLIGQTMADAGYDAAYSFEVKSISRPPRWEDVLAYDAHHITLRQPALLDFGAAGKGYLVDIICELIEQAGVSSFIIDAGGDILHRSADNRTIEVGLENPFDTSEAIGVLGLSNRSLCASAGSKRKWQGFHHIIDPETLRSTEGIIATWVMADDTMVADGLATALFFASPRQLQAQFAFSYAMLDKNMSLSYSKNFPVKLFEAASP